MQAAGAGALACLPIDVDQLVAAAVAALGAVTATLAAKHRSPDHRTRSGDRPSLPSAASQDPDPELDEWWGDVELEEADVGAPVDLTTFRRAYTDPDALEEPEPLTPQEQGRLREALRRVRGRNL